MTTSASSPYILIAAAEVSADLHAASLARSILQKLPTASLYGCGGSEMAKAGVDIRIFTAQLGYVKIRESWFQSSTIKQTRRELHRWVHEQRPNLAILIDSERFNGALIKLLAKEKIPIVYYLSPQVAFWAPWRAKKYAKLSSLIIPAFSSELDLLKRAGARATWVGHPLLDLLNLEETENAPGRPPPLSQNDRVLIGLMPGSRMQEVNLFTPIVLNSVLMMRAARPDLAFVLPVASPHLAAPIETMIETKGLTNIIQIVDRNPHLWIRRCDLLLASTGTVTLEAAILGTPMVTFYKLNPITYIVARALVRTPFIALPNIVLNRESVPELIQRKFTAKRLADTALALLSNPKLHDKMVRDLAKTRKALGEVGAIDRATDLILGELGKIRGHRTNVD